MTSIDVAAVMLVGLAVLVGLIVIDSETLWSLVGLAVIILAVMGVGVAIWQTWVVKQSKGAQMTVSLGLYAIAGAAPILVVARWGWSGLLWGIGAILVAALIVGVIKGAVDWIARMGSQ